jgi:hypothetical protein
MTVPKIELGRIGAAINLGDGPGAVEAAAELAPHLIPST